MCGRGRGYRGAGAHSPALHAGVHPDSSRGDCGATSPPEKAPIAPLGSWLLLANLEAEGRQALSFGRNLAMSEARSGGERSELFLGENVLSSRAGQGPMSFYYQVCALFVPSPRQWAALQQHLELPGGKVRSVGRTERLSRPMWRLLGITFWLKM